jgi:ABC-2 type transport system ATP-binding protein
VSTVVADHLVKTYPGDVKAVRDVSFTVEPGEAFGLLGPNGAGKTTTIGMLNSTVKPTSGRAVLAGRDVAVDPIGTRAISSVVFQDSVVDQPLTGRQNLELHLKLWGASGPESRKHVAELIDIGGLAEVIDRPVATYSGGQRRRLEIVRALSSSPQVLFLDEPTVGLDTRVRHDLFDAIGSLRDRTGVTIIMTTHYLDEAERLCDRLAIIDKGRVVACDTPARLLESVGSEVVEVRADDPDAVRAIMRHAGVDAQDILAIGATVTAGLRPPGPGGAFVLQELAGSSVLVRSATTRHPSLDDVYLRLTGDRIGADDQGEQR